MPSTSRRIATWNSLPDQDQLLIPPDVSRAWDNVLNSIHPPKHDLDLAMSKFHDGWSVIVTNEEDTESNMKEVPLINFASHIILEIEGDDGKRDIQLHIMGEGVVEYATFDPFSMYPKLFDACNNIINGTNAEFDTMMKSKAYTVSGYLKSHANDGQDLFGRIKREARRDIESAISLNPSDWRLRVMLATRYMMNREASKALEYIGMAKELTVDPYATYCLSLKQGKILHHLGRSKEAIAAFNETLSLYDDGLKNHPSMNDRAVGKLAISQYMLVITYMKQGMITEAATHYRDAEKKRISFDKEGAKGIDWSNRKEATKYVLNLDYTLLSGDECHYCGKVFDIPKRCAGCKLAFYCSERCQKLAWKSGHREECKDQMAQRSEECVLM